MITYAEALRLLLSEAKPIEDTETIPLMYSTGRVLAEDIASPIDVPGWDNSQMDGYALRVEDIASASQDAPVRLPVAERIAAGKIGIRLLRENFRNLLSFLFCPAVRQVRFFLI